MKLIRSLSVLFLIPILLSPLFGGVTGKIAGRITEKNSGEGLYMADVVITDLGIGTSTDGDGHFVIVNVPPGIYELSIHYIGYTNVIVKEVKVSVDRTTTVNNEMQIESINAQAVTVTAHRPAIEIDRTHTAAIVDAKMVESMPVTELSEVIQLQSGVVSSDGELHFRGGRGREVAYLVDGIPVSNNYSQSGGNNVSVQNSMVEELEVISGTFNAEYGSAQSGIVNIVTKQVSRDFDFNFKGYCGDYLSSHNDIYLGVDHVNPFAEKDLQAVISGPIIPGKLGFFVSERYNNWESLGWYERRYNSIDGWRIAAYEKWFKQHNANDAASSSGIYIPDSLKTGDGKMGPLETGDSHSLSGKLMFIPTGKTNLSYQVFVSTKNESKEKSSSDESSRRYQPDNIYNYESLAHSHFLTFRHAPAENLFYNLSVSYQFNHSDTYYRKDNKIALYPGDSGIQLISASSNGFSLGNTGSFYTGKDGKDYRKIYLMKGDINWQANRFNFLKAGFEVKQTEVNTYSWGYRATDEWENYSFPTTSSLDPSLYEFSEYWDILVDYWKNWEEIYGTDRYIMVPDSEYTNWRDYTIKPVQYAMYVQDKIEMGDIIVNAGLRFDAFQPNEKYPVNLRTEAVNIGSDGNLKDASVKYQVSPRLGISFPISDAGAFHASYGHFFQIPSFQYMYNEPLYVINKYDLEDMKLGNADLKPEKTIAYEIGIQQAITSSIAVDITAYYKDFRNLLGIERKTTIDAVGYYRYVNRDYGNTRGLAIEISKNTGFVTGKIAYTLSYANGSESDPNEIHLIETASSYGSEQEEFVDRRILPLNWDQRHILNAYINLNKADNWSMGFIGYVKSGLPYSPTFLEEFDISESEYRNADNKPFCWNVDFKAQKYIKFAGLNSIVFLKIDNVFDHLNEVGVYSTTGRAGQNARLPEDEALELEELEQEGHFTLEEIDLDTGHYSSPRKVQLGFEVRL